ncbi:MAG: divalent metal cation transporter [Parcubacteria group bacterium]|nr:divalent metal cation transporter [Parcubacteria group bacterium]
MLAHLRRFYTILGPGLLFAGAAIGVSHLVQSTRAGAEFGFALILFVILANIFKYPFFEFGSRYTAATGKSLIEGYKSLGRFALPLFGIFTLATMFIIAATVTIVTSGLAIQVTGLDLPIMYWNMIVVALVTGILMIGKFKWLESFLKIIVLSLAGITMVALVFALVNGMQGQANFVGPAVLSTAGVTFLIALMGWMPAPIEISIWHSVWATEERHGGHKVSKKDSSLDFNIGYIGTAIFALVFLVLGAFVLYGTGEVFADSAAGFAGQLIDMYTNALGDWAWWVIAITAQVTMFSTTLTVFDAYPRVMNKLVRVSSGSTKYEGRVGYIIWLLFLGVGSLLILATLVNNMKALVTFATVMSFLTGPLFAYLNYRVVTKGDMPENMRPAPWLRALSVLGLVFLVSFSIFYIGWVFFL